ncbi:MAG: 16S rRNA (guanine(527)-N(7))-methyltransferase RsmG [Epsilonproteobacteria bacterium]|nr:16S rRNA (guanine(527)-N(7))-methyltransferase RsmG [Campylobacterota bacterium]
MDKFEIFTKELLKWNKTHKLTNYNKEEIKKQIEDSLYPLQFLTKTPKSAIDIGTGAGFPGLILAMAMPQTKWYLVEPLKKRYGFLNYIKVLLNLNNTQIIPKRIEEFDKKADLITSRAVMPTIELIKLSDHLLNEDGLYLFYKGENAKEETKDVSCQIVNNGKRNYIFIRK